MTQSETESKLANYMIGRYRLGYGYLAVYLAAVLFESIIESKHRRQQDRLNQVVGDRTLHQKITALDENTMRGDSILRYKDQHFMHFVDNDGQRKRIANRYGAVGKLLNFKDVRNDVMHFVNMEYISDNKSIVEEMLLYVWAELNHDSFNRAVLKRQAPRGIIESLYETTADYFIRAVDEKMIVDSAGKFSGIRIEDFENLFELRRKMVLLQLELIPWMAKHAPRLRPDIVTTIDTTSGYIWMPFPTKAVVPEGERLGVKGASVSILATPLDFRVYLDFGGYAKTDRETYYRFLESDHYQMFHKTYGQDSDFKVFDIDWYGAIFNIRDCPRWLEEMPGRIAKAKIKIKTAEQPITWNRMLHGFLIDKHKLDDKTFITSAFLEPMLLQVISLYDAYMDFSSNGNGAKK